MTTQAYDVALWRYWHPNDKYCMEVFPFTEVVEADSPLRAALTLMDTLHLKYVAHVSVGWPGCGLERWRNNDQALSLYTPAGSGDPGPDEPEEEDEETTQEEVIS